jgi:erythronate-4-phosphate dehydrogenase
MKIVIDDKIPFIRGILEPFAEVVYLPGGQIRREHLMDAECLIVRTRTTCNRQLLEGTAVRFIATATIGFDHIDTEYCQAAGIKWTNSPGCNSGSVAQYITVALLIMADRYHFDLTDKTLGIIGVGHVGSKVKRIAEILGMKVLLNDPPRARAEGPEGFVDLKTVLTQSDIITLHVPLIRDGEDKTWNLVDRNFLETLKPGAVLMNTSRGEVVDEEEVVDLASLLSSRRKPGSPDWSSEEGDPGFRRDDSAASQIFNHWSLVLDGKLNATRMVVEAVIREFYLTDDGRQMTDETPSVVSLPSSVLSTGHGSRVTGHSLQDYLLETYDLPADDRRLRESPETFEEQRNNYPVRREFTAYQIDPFPTGDLGAKLTSLGFTLLP